MSESNKNLIGFLIGFFALMGAIFTVGLIIFMMALGVCYA